MSTGAILLSLILLLPFAGAGAMLFFRKRGDHCAFVGCASAGLTLLFVLLLDAAILSGSLMPATFTLIEPWPGLALAWHLESFGLLFANLACLLWLATSLYAMGYMRANGEKELPRFYAFFAISMGAALALALAENLFTLFAAYELLTLATCPLVIHRMTPEAKRGARTYLMVLMGTSLALLLPAIIITWLVAGTLSFTPGGILAGKIGPAAALGLLLLFAFGLGKAGLMPFHRWLPAAMVAPTPVSALLHAVAVVKAGIFSLLKITAYIFGADVLQAGAGDALILIAGVSVLTASLIALRQDNLKRRLAYSTVSQLGFAGLAAGLAVPGAWAAGALHLVCHALAKISLFMCAGAMTTASGKKNISQLDGLARHMPLTCAAFLVAALSITGLPPFAGFWSKLLLMLAAAETPMAWFVIAVLLLSSLLNVAYLVIPGLRMFYMATPDEAGSIKERPLLCVLPPVLTAFLCSAPFWIAGPLYRWINLFPTPLTP